MIVLSPRTVQRRQQLPERVDARLRRHLGATPGPLRPHLQVAGAAAPQPSAAARALSVLEPPDDPWVPPEPPPPPPPPVPPPPAPWPPLRATTARAARRRRLAAEATGAAAERVESGRCRRPLRTRAGRRCEARAGCGWRFRAPPSGCRTPTPCRGGLADDLAERIAHAVVGPGEGHVRTGGQEHQRRSIDERESVEEARGRLATCRTLPGSSVP